MGAWKGIWEAKQDYDARKERDREFELRETEAENLQKAREANLRLKTQKSFFDSIGSRNYSRSNTKLKSNSNEQSQVYKEQLISWGLKPEHIAHIDSFNDPDAISNTWTLANTARNNLAKIHGVFNKDLNPEIDQLYKERLNTLVSGAIGMQGQDIKSYNTAMLNLATEAGVEIDEIFMSRLNQESQRASQGNVTFDESLTLFKKPEEEKEPKDITGDVIGVMKYATKRVDNVYDKLVQDLTLTTQAFSTEQKEGFYKYIDPVSKQTVALNEEEIMRLRNQVPQVIDVLEQYKNNEALKNSLFGENLISSLPKNYQTNPLLLTSIYGKDRDNKVYLDLVPKDWETQDYEKPNLLFDFLYSNKLLPRGTRISRISNGKKVSSIVTYLQD